jgi:hypothetical protein
VDEKVVLASDVMNDERKPFTLAALVRPTHERTVRLFEKGSAFQAYTGKSENVPYYKRGSPLTLHFGERQLVSEEPLLYTVHTHVAIAYDGSEFKLFFDGRPIPLRIVKDGPARFANREPLVIRDFQGQMDDLRLYNRVLSQAELTDLALNLSPLRREIPLAKTPRQKATARAQLSRDAAPRVERAAGSRNSDRAAKYPANPCPRDGDD